MKGKSRGGEGGSGNKAIEGIQERVKVRDHIPKQLQKLPSNHIFMNLSGAE